MTQQSNEPKKEATRHVILVNGPPGSGKDTCVNAIFNYVSIHASYMRPQPMKISEHLKKATHALHNVFQPWNYYDRPENAHLKDVPCQEFYGDSPRDAYIAMADFAMGRYGDDFFGWPARRSMRQAQGSMLFLFSDCGFLPELVPVITLATPARTLLIELHREGKDFSKDSRGYISEEFRKQFPQARVQRINNPADDKELFRVYCQGAAKAFLGIEEKD